MPIDTNWLINRDLYGPEEARKMRRVAGGRARGETGIQDAPAERNGWLIGAGNRTSIREAVASALANPGSARRCSPRAP